MSGSSSSETESSEENVQKILSHHVPSQKFSSNDQPLHILHQTLATYRYENTLVKTELAATLDRHKKELKELHYKYENQVRFINMSFISRFKLINNLLINIFIDIFHH